MEKPKMFSTRVDPDLIKEIKHLAVDTERPISDIVEEALRNLLAKYRKGKT